MSTPKVGSLGLAKAVPADARRHLDAAADHVEGIRVIEDRAGLEIR